MNNDLQSRFKLDDGKIHDYETGASTPQKPQTGSSPLSASTETIAQATSPVLRNYINTNPPEKPKQYKENLPNLPRNLQNLRAPQPKVLGWTPGSFPQQRNPLLPNIIPNYTGQQVGQQQNVQNPPGQVIADPDAAVIHEGEDEVDNTANAQLPLIAQPPLADAQRLGGPPQIEQPNVETPKGDINGTKVSKLGKAAAFLTSDTMRSVAIVVLFVASAVLFAGALSGYGAPLVLPAAFCFVAALALMAGPAMFAGDHSEATEGNNQIQQANRLWTEVDTCNKQITDKRQQLKEITDQLDDPSLELTDEKRESLEAKSQQLKNEIGPLEVKRDKFRADAEKLENNSQSPSEPTTSPPSTTAATNPPVPANANAANVDGNQNVGVNREENISRLQSEVGNLDQEYRNFDNAGKIENYETNLDDRRAKLADKKEDLAELLQQEIASAEAKANNLEDGVEKTVLNQKIADMQNKRSELLKPVNKLSLSERIEMLKSQNKKLDLEQNEEYFSNNDVTGTSEKFKSLQSKIEENNTLIGHLESNSPKKAMQIVKEQITQLQHQLSDRNVRNKDSLEKILISEKVKLGDLIHKEIEDLHLDLSSTSSPQKKLDLQNKIDTLNADLRKLDSDYSSYTISITKEYIAGLEDSLDVFDLIKPNDMTDQQILDRDFVISEIVENKKLIVDNLNTALSELENKRDLLKAQLGENAADDPQLSEITKLIFDNQIELRDFQIETTHSDILRLTRQGKSLYESYKEAVQRVKTNTNPDNRDPQVVSDKDEISRFQTLDANRKEKRTILSDLVDAQKLALAALTPQEDKIRNLDKILASALSPKVQPKEPRVKKDIQQVIKEVQGRNTTKAQDIFKMEDKVNGNQQAKPPLRGIGASKDKAEGGPHQK
ncbi:MAG: hypothetical protein H0T62_10230 [Parachlamydiaceae bacterium]|nr:hypothetical protein [Parachlamydiaceae bacterium]